MGAKENNLEYARKELALAAEKLNRGGQAELEFEESIRKLRSLGEDPLSPRPIDRRKPTKLERAARHYLEAEDALARELWAKETVPKELGCLESAAIDLLAAGHRGLPLDRFVPDRNELDEFVFWVKYWKQKTEQPVPFKVLRLSREYFEAETTWVTGPRPSPPNLIAEGCETAGQWDGPYFGPPTYVNGAKQTVPSYCPFSTWFTANPFVPEKWWSADIWVDELAGLGTGTAPYPPSHLFGWLYFYVDIPVDASGTLHLSVKSEATMSVSDFLWLLAWFYSDEWRLVPQHNVRVRHLAPDGTITWLTEENLLMYSFEKKYVRGADPQDFERLLEGTEVGTSPWPDLIGSSRTVIEAGYPKIMDFQGPCTIRIYEQARYLTNVRNGHGGLGGTGGHFGPLCWWIRRP